MKTSEVDDRIHSLTAKCFANECDEQEHDELNSWINLNSENKNFFDEAIAALTHTQNTLYALNIDEESAFKHISGKIQKNETNDILKAKKVKKLKLWLRVAASLLLIISVSIAYIMRKSQPADQTTITTAYNEIKQITLPDGSGVVLNGNSSIIFPAEFGNGNRDVSMSGEAFFNITPDKTHPFVINTKVFKVKVLGTSFNVKAYNSKEASVVVETGTVQVTSENSTVTITKGEAAILDKKSGNIKRSKNRDINFKAWKTKQIRFVNTGLKNALTTLENVYKVDIEVEDNNILTGRRIDADFDKQSIEFILNTICKTYHLNYTKNGNKYLITGKK